MIIGIFLLLINFITFLKNNYHRPPKRTTYAVKNNGNIINQNNTKNNHNNNRNTAKSGDNNKNNNKSHYNKNKIFSILLGITLLRLLIMLLSAFSKVSFVYTGGLFFLVMLIFYILFSRFGGKNFNYDLLIFTWFFNYMIFFSIHTVKLNRYFTTMTPAFAFLEI